MNLTRWTHKWVKDNLTLEDALPTSMPLYVNSLAYLFGMLMLCALAWILLTGVILTIFGANWYHVSPAGHFINSLHIWSVQVLFVGLILHLTFKFCIAGWRDGRWLTWMVGVLAFGAFIFTALTGFLAQTNWDSQWIAVQAKDAFNAAGIGFWLNTMNIGQIWALHMVLFPLIVVALVALHLYLIRHDSPVRPIPQRRIRDESSVR